MLEVQNERRKKNHFVELFPDIIQHVSGRKENVAICNILDQHYKKENCGGNRILSRLSTQLLLLPLAWSVEEKLSPLEEKGQS